jgi:hypothetical protein
MLPERGGRATHLAWFQQSELDDNNLAPAGDKGNRGVRVVDEMNPCGKGTKGSPTSGRKTTDVAFWTARSTTLVERGAFKAHRGMEWTIVRASMLVATWWSVTLDAQSEQSGSRGETGLA